MAHRIAAAGLDLTVWNRTPGRAQRFALLDKDVANAAAFLRDQKVPSPVVQLAAELMRLSHAELGNAADHVEAVQLVERWSGVEIS
jgi:3-hydroxyisobutyrate dehydrogenase-like beta-hydroxyacid dehydrogenase